MADGIFGWLGGGSKGAAASTSASTAGAGAAAPAAGAATGDSAPAPAAAGAAGAGAAAAADPMAGFSGMWEALAKQREAQAAGTAQSVALTPEQVAQAAANANFAGNIDPNLAAVALGGGEGAVQALAQIINQASRNAFAQAVAASSGIAERAASAQRQQIQGQLPTLVKDAQFQDQLLGAMPQLNNPTMQPMVEIIRAGIAANNPTFTPSQLAEKTREFLAGFASVTAPQQQQTAGAAQGATQAVNWNAYFSNQ